LTIGDLAGELPISEVKVALHHGFVVGGGESSVGTFVEAALILDGLEGVAQIGGSGLLGVVISHVPLHIGVVLGTEFIDETADVDGVGEGLIRVALIIGTSILTIREALRLKQSASSVGRIFESRSDGGTDVLGVDEDDALASIELGASSVEDSLNPSYSELE
jgi:hypothetical protein